MQFDQENPQPRGNQIVPNEALVIQYLEWHERIKRSEDSTIDTYGHTLTAFSDWLGARSILTASADDCENFVHLPKLNGSQRSVNTIQRRLSTLGGLYTWAIRAGHLSSSPTALLVAPKSKGGQSSESPHDLLENEYWSTIWEGDRLTHLDRCLLGLGFFCGLRRTEMLKLQGKHITDTHLKNFWRKGDQRHQLDWRLIVDITNTLNPELKASEWASRFSRYTRDLEPEQYLCDFYDPSGVASHQGNKLTRRMNSMGNRHYIRLTPHMLRHSAATNLVMSGFPIVQVSEMLNHSSLTTTQRYVRVTQMDARQWLKQRRQQGGQS